jgi:hypothetical protein
MIELLQLAETFDPNWFNMTKVSSSENRPLIDMFVDRKSFNQSLPPIKHPPEKMV